MDGALRTLALSAGISPSREGTPAWTATMLDITDRKQSEDALRASESKYRTLFDATSDAVVLFDRGGFLDCNSAALRLFGCRSTGELLAKPLVAFSPASQLGGERSKTLAEAWIDEAFSQGSARFEWQHARVDGTLFPSEVVLSRMQIDGKEVLQAVVRDITERRQMEEEHERSRAALARRVETATGELRRLNDDLRKQIAVRERAEKSLRQAYRELDSVFRTAASGLCLIDKDFNILRTNQALAQIAGVPVEQMLGRKCYEVIAYGDCGTERCSLRRVLDGEELVDKEVTRLSGDGREIPCFVVAHPHYSEAGELIGIIQDTRDVSEHKRLESIAQAVNVTDNLRYAFSGIRHELGNPVHAIKMTLSVLKMKLGEMPPGTVAAYVDRALADLSRMELLLHSLRSFSMYENLEPELVNVGSFFSRLEKLLAPDLEQVGIALSVVAPTNSDSIRADPRALQQVFLNLVTNACDALQGRRAPAVTLEAWREGPFIELAVRDNGCGMPPAQLQELFKPFYTNKPKGTGLGLVIVRKMLAKMDATIEVQSVSGEGTTVRLSFRAPDTRPSMLPPSRPN